MSRLVKIIDFPSVLLSSFLSDNNNNNNNNDAPLGSFFISLDRGFGLVSRWFWKIGFGMRMATTTEQPLSKKAGLLVTVSERTPLLRGDSAASSTYGSNENEYKYVVDFEGPDDTENPIYWPKAYKWTAVFLLALFSSTVAFTGVSLVPVANTIIQELGGSAASSASSTVLLVTIWELGEAIGPLFLAPLSEMYGRYRVVNTANIMFTASTILASFAPSIPTLIGARFLSGLSNSASVLNPAIVGDMFPPEERGAAMSILIFAPMCGGAVGPAVAGIIAENLGWRSVLWIAASMAGLCEVFFLIFFKETFAVTILARRAERLRKDTQISAFKSIHEVQGTELEKKPTIMGTLLRPVVVLSKSGVLQVLSLFGALSFAYWYVVATTLPEILSDIYGLSPSTVGASFLSFSAGCIMMIILCNRTLDRIYTGLRDKNAGLGRPEFRLPLAILGGAFLPVVVFSYGWVPSARLPLPVCLLTVGAMGACTLLGCLPLTAYVVDAFGLYSASAMTAVVVMRCLMSTILPLVTGDLISRMGYRNAFGVLALVTACIVPLPVLVWRYGPVWRQRSMYTRQQL
ncbi:major facilitator superfamily transporter [Lecanosticta acicola]|uniref:Major facilitator superfamily transporter n=1 Tax=Lecanosticta acicola TaxID=111012 RepID=A0AAI8YXW8_9PEZI|nr:major facilitator superfamily transporter [Lecanosticta acicola]